MNWGVAAPSDRLCRLMVVARRMLPITVLAGTAALAAGCGGGSSSNGVASKSPEAIVTAAKAAAESAKSLHVVGNVASNGQPVTFDLQLLAGKGARGRLSEGGYAFQLVRIGTTAYIQGSAAFYKHLAGPAAAQLLAGKWLKGSSATGDLASLTSFTDPKSLFESALSNHGTIVKSGTTTVGGQRVVTLTDTTKGGTLQVATTGQPYPVELGKSGSGGGKITFDQWNQPVTLTAPANAIDVAQLQGR